MFKNSLQNSKIYPYSKPTDVTYESAFPNVTHEELHLSINKYNFNGTLDETNSQFILNNNSVGNVTNTTLANNNTSQ